MRFPGQRALRVTLRTAHIAAVAWLLGAAIYGGAPQGPLGATLLSGAAMVAESLVRHGGDWLRYLGSWVILAKLGLLVLALWTGLSVWVLLAALAAGSLISHAPGRIRQFPLWGEPGPCAGGGSSG